MTRPENMQKTTLRYQMAAVARDVSSISATMIVLASVFWFVSKPYLQPWLSLPEQIAVINARLAPIADPHLIDFRGTPQVIGGTHVFKPGDTILFSYDLRRNAACSTQIDISWFAVRTGSRVTTSTQSATQAPVTQDFAPFILSREVPDNLPDGFYQYYPRIIPIDCGVYKPYNGPLSEIFEIRREK